MLSLPAISQSVTVVNGDTLICLPDNLTRKVIADLEAGDLCKIELASWITEAKGLREVISIQKEQIAVKDKTIKALNEFDQLSKEAWETVNIATDHGIIPARIQAIKLAGEIATKKAQLHKLMGATQSDGQFIARMQKAENVNQILSRILRDVIFKYPNIAEEVRKELQIAFDIMNEG